MNLQHRTDLMVRLGEYVLSGDVGWQEAKEKASQENSWFIPEFIDLSAENIARSYLQRDKLENWAAGYQVFQKESFGQTPTPELKSIGIVMAGNIPLVGFHDFLAVFIAGHKAIIKPSSRDKTLIQHLTDKLSQWDPVAAERIQYADMLKNCDAYIATGSNNSFRYFEYYFRRFPHIIRRNRTSVAILNGKETTEELGLLADDVYLYFGMGCRNVSKIYTPEAYDFIPLLEAFKKYNWLADHHKYRNNYDYNLALHLLNRKFYMTNGSILLTEETSFFSHISGLNYSAAPTLPEGKGGKEKFNGFIKELQSDQNIQCIVGRDFVPFGRAQYPSLTDYADGVDTLQFLSQI